VHHRRRGLTRVAAVVAALLLTVAAGGCSGADAGQGSGAAEGTRPTGSIVPGGSTPSSLPGTTPSSAGTTGPDGSGGGTTTGSGDPSEGIPQDQFCRGFREVHSAESAMSKAREDDDLTGFQNAFSRIVVAWQAMAENPPDEVYDEMRAVFFMYDELAAQVADAQTIDDLTEIALALQTDDRAEDLEVVRDHGAASC
jgi:hypothetical protein